VTEGQRALAPAGEALLPFDLPPGGGFDVTVDYTLDSSDLGVFVARADCPLGTLRSWACPEMATAQPRSRPLRIVQPQASHPFASGGPLVLYVLNAGPRPESIAFQVVFGQGRCWS
jgi:hypothetical protein